MLPADRRLELRQGLERCLQVAQEHDADLVTIGGDLWEEEHVTADTRSWVAAKLEALGRPVAIICGNHDPLLSGGSHARTAWPANVHRFSSEEPTEFKLEDVSVWGASWTGSAFSAAFLERFTAPPDERNHVLLIHGTAGASVYLDQEGRYAPFDVQAVSRAGFTVCLAGHIHAGHQIGPVIYPGSPEPLARSETRRHCVALVEIAGDGNADVELIDVNARQYASAEVSVAGAESSADIERAVAQALGQYDPETVYPKLTLTGEIDLSCEVQVTELCARHEQYRGLVIVDQTRPQFDFTTIADRPTALGRFVRDLTEQIESDGSDEPRETLELARLAGVRAMTGVAEVLNVD